MGRLPAKDQPKKGRGCPRLARERTRYTSSIYHSVVSFLSRTVSGVRFTSQPLLQHQDVMSRLNLFTGRQVRKESAHSNGFFKRPHNPRRGIHALSQHHVFLQSYQDVVKRACSTQTVQLVILWLRESTKNLDKKGKVTNGSRSIV